MTTICHYSRLFATIRYSRLIANRYSSFSDILLKVKKWPGKKKTFPYEEGQVFKNVSVIYNGWKEGLPGQVEAVTISVIYLVRKILFFITGKSEKNTDLVVLSLTQFLTLWVTNYVCNRPHSIYQYSNMAPRLSGQTSSVSVLSPNTLSTPSMPILDSLRRRANARNVSFRISLRWPIYFINPVDKTELSCDTPHRRSTTVSLETYPLYLGKQLTPLVYRAWLCKMTTRLRITHAVHLKRGDEFKAPEDTCSVFPW